MNGLIFGQNSTSRCTHGRKAVFIYYQRCEYVALLAMKVYKHLLLIDAIDKLVLKARRSPEGIFPCAHN